jgi:replicative DNA helicase
VNVRTAHVPPHSIEAEMSTLGSMMLDQHAIEKVAEILRPDDFYREAHRILYEVILSLAERHIPVDLLTVQEELRRRDQLEEIGGLPALVQIVESVPTASNAEYYARIVEEKAILRRLIRAAHDILQLADDPELELQDVIDRAEQAIFSVAQRRLGRYFSPIDRLLLQALEHIERVQLSGRGILGIPTHFPALDYKTSGLQPSELIILAARPSVGKTALALNIAENVALRENRPVALFSLEMSREQLVQRMLCSQAGVSGNRIRHGTLTEEDWERLQMAAERLFRAPIFIDDTSGLSVLRCAPNAAASKPNATTSPSSSSTTCSSFGRTVGVPRTAIRRLARLRARSKGWHASSKYRCWCFRSSPAPSSDARRSVLSSPTCATAAPSKPKPMWCFLFTAPTVAATS